MDIEEIYKTFFNKVLNFIQKGVDNHDTALELTQEVFIKLIKADYKTIEVSVSSLIFKIAKNTLIDFYRSKKNTTKFSDEIYDEEFFCTEDINLFESDVHGCVLNMMDKLSVEDKALLTSVDIENEGQKQLAEKLNLSYSALKSKVQRARKKLFNELVNCCEFSKDRRGNTSFCKSKGC